LTNPFNGAIIPQPHATELFNAQYERMASHSLGAGQYHPPDIAVLLRWHLNAGVEARSQSADAYINRNAY